MKRVMLFFLAACLGLALAACSSPQSPTATTTCPVMDVPTEGTTATVQTDAGFEIQSTESTEETAEPTEETVPATERTHQPNLVSICRADFPIYNGPGYDYSPVGTVQVATVYTIVEEVWDSEGNLWGRLKSGAGWVDLSRNERETNHMPPVSVSRADQKLLDSGDYYYCCADTSEYAYEIVFHAHETLTDVSFYAIDVADEFIKGPELFCLTQWDSGKPLVVSVSFPGSASLFGLEFTDSHGVTHIYSVWESGRNGSVEISLFTEPLAAADGTAQ